MGAGHSWNYKQYARIIGIGVSNSTEGLGGTGRSLIFPLGEGWSPSRGSGNSGLILPYHVSQLVSLFLENFNLSNLSFNFFDKTVRNFYRFSSFLWNKNLFNLGNVQYQTSISTLSTTVPRFTNRLPNLFNCKVDNVTM